VSEDSGPLRKKVTFEALTEDEVNTIALALYRKGSRVKQENKLRTLDRLNSPAKQFLLFSLDCILNENFQGFDLCGMFHNLLLTNWLPCFMAKYISVN
jgi:hypothetical protein